ncbi:MAG TPA: hypothetical protein VJJ81_00600 [Candidatus Babeliales bacterium]|nr:hypothetical protein [Candidatus Babeliales bacterium]
MTKYNPKNRDSNGIYLLDEWTFYAQIGTVVAGKVFTYEEYLAAENAYVAALIVFMKCNNLEALQIVNFENNLKFKKDIYLSDEMIIFLKKIKDVVSANIIEVDLLTRLILREKLWCMFTSDVMSVRFGWDYYMYIGSINKCEKGIQKIEQQGLFVEECDSSYLDA